MNTLLYAKVGRVAVRQLHHKHHHKDCGFLPPHLPLDGITREMDAALDHLIAISDWASPRTINLEDSTAGYVTLVGDAFFELNGKKFGLDSNSAAVNAAWTAHSGASSPSFK